MEPFESVAFPGSDAVRSAPSNEPPFIRNDEELSGLSLNSSRPFTEISYAAGVSALVGYVTVERVKRKLRHRSGRRMAGSLKE